MRDPFEVPTKFNEMLSFWNVALAIVMVVVGLLLMRKGQDVAIVLIIAPIWGAAWFLRGIQQRKARIQRQLEVQQLKARLMEVR